MPAPRPDQRRASAPASTRRAGAIADGRSWAVGAGTPSIRGVARRRAWFTGARRARVAASASRTTTISAPCQTQRVPVGGQRSSASGRQRVDPVLPRPIYSRCSAMGLLRSLGSTIRALRDRLRPALVSRRVVYLSRGTFFAREAFGRDALVSAIRRRPPTRLARLADYVGAFRFRTPARRNFSISIGARATRSRPVVDEEGEGPQDDQLSRLPHQDLGCNARWRIAFRAGPLGFFGLGCDAVGPPICARFRLIRASAGRPAGEAQSRARRAVHLPLPGRNASLAAPPGARPGGRALRPPHHGRPWCWRASTTTRSTCAVRNVRIRSTRRHRRAPGRAESACRYVRDGRGASRSRRATRAGLLPHGDPHIISPTCRPPQRDALAQNVKTPLVYTNVIGATGEPW